MSNTGSNLLRLLRQRFSPAEEIRKLAWSLQAGFSLGWVRAWDGELEGGVPLGGPVGRDNNVHEGPH